MIDLQMIDLQISDRTHLALARAKEIAGPDESGPFEPEAKLFMDSLVTDIVRALLRPVVDQLACGVRSGTCSPNPRP